MPLLVSADYNRQCIHAAESSRLHPTQLHPGEYQLIGNRLINSESTSIYVNIRNGILRLWIRNPTVCVTRDEAIDLVQEKKYIPLAHIAFEWLARHGYINFGCVHISDVPRKTPSYITKRKTIVVIGAGVAGLSCARHLTGLCKQFPERWLRQKELPPRIVVIEGRRRIGGRVYSHTLRDQQNNCLPDTLANTAELGAQIITGFERGNPLDVIVRAQLNLEYNQLKDDLSFYDFDGSQIDSIRDYTMEALYVKMLEVVNEHKWQPVAKNPLERKSSAVVSESKNIHVSMPSPVSMGYSSGINGVKGYFPNQPPSLGALMDQIVTGYQHEQGLSAQDLRLLNWHYANLEYANAINVGQLSLGGWDQDGGNEFEGAHCHIVGGYSQVPKGLYSHPDPLDVRIGKIVDRVNCKSYANSGQPKHSIRVECLDGDTFEADQVVCTLPLGVLKRQKVAFDPPLPQWKTSAIERLGFGVLNKVILIFDQMFWDLDRDMLGVLNRARGRGMCQADYASDRGKCYMFWNCSKTCGRPMLTALMAGDAAIQAEAMTDADIVNDVTKRLARVFQLSEQPKPIEAIVTRWRKDPFACGSYSSLGIDSEPGDYEEMARPIGALHFAGEATCGTHPATVHGAYLSGLRVAAEVMESMVGSVPSSGIS